MYHMTRRIYYIKIHSNTTIRRTSRKDVFSSTQIQNQSDIFYSHLYHNICPPVKMDNIRIPTATEATYFGLHLTWKIHIQAKRKQLDLKFRQNVRILGQQSKLSHQDKILLHKTILKSIWVYGLHLWGCAKPTSLNISQRFQSKVLRSIMIFTFTAENMQRVNKACK